MGDLTAIVVISDRVLHCIDFSRPVWARPGDLGNSIIPNPAHFVVDGLLAHASDLFGLPTFSWNAYGVDGKQLPMDHRAPQPLVDARNAIYAATEPSLLYVSLSGFDTYEREDLTRLSLPITCAVRAE